MTHFNFASTCDEFYEFMSQPKNSDILKDILGKLNSSMSLFVYGKNENKFCFDLLRLQRKIS